MQWRRVVDGGPGKRGVSNVVAMVLVIAITVALAGAVGIYLTDVGGGLDEPRPTFASTTAYDADLDRNGQYLNVTHEGGESIDTDRIRLDVVGAESVTAAGGSAVDASLTSDDHVADQVGSEFTVTETIVLSRENFTASGTPLPPTRYVDLDDAVVRIVWEAESGRQSAILYECRPATPDCEGSST